MPQTSDILDIVIGAVLALFVIMGISKGFFRTLADLVLVFVSAFGANLIAKNFAGHLAAFIAPFIREKVISNLTEQLGDFSLLLKEAAAANTDLPALSSIKLPEGFTLPEGIDLSALTGGKLPADVDFSALAESVLSASADQLIHTLSFGILFLIAFLALTVMLKLAVSATDLALRLPVLRQCTRLGGAVLGLAMGCLIVWIGVRLCLTFNLWVTQEMADGSRLLALLEKLPPVLDKFEL